MADKKTLTPRQRKYKAAFKRLKKTWDSRKTVKGKRHVSWGGKRGAFSAIAKAAAAECNGKPRGGGKKKAAKKPAKKKAAKKPARKKARAAGSGKKKPAKRKASTAKKRYVVGGKKRAGLMTAHQASELRKRTGKKVKLAATQGAGQRKRRGMSTGAKVLIGVAAVVGVVAIGGAVVAAVRKGNGNNGQAAMNDQGEEDEF